LKIVYISNTPLPSRAASGFQIMKMCQAFQEMGHDVKLLAPRIDGRPVNGFDYKRHYGTNRILDLRHIRTRHLFHRHDYCLISAICAKAHRADLVYSRNLGSAVWCSALGLSTIFEAHGLPDSKVKKFYFKILMKFAALKRVVVISEALRELFLEIYGGRLNENMMLVAPDGVDMERFRNLPPPTQARHKIGLDKDKALVGYAGHLYKGRGIRLILRLAQQLPHVQFLAVGGDDRSISDYTDMAASQGLNNIRFAGFVINSELPLYLAACDVLLMPYQRQVKVSGGEDTSAWMSPMKMFEYMATGRVIISSDLPVLREVLNEGNSILCDPGDLNAWKRNIKGVLDDRSLQKRLGDQARRDAEQYSWMKRAKYVLSGLESGNDSI